MVEWLVEWYDSVELWLVQLVYPLQVILVFAVLLPLCWLLAGAVDRGAGRVASKLSRSRNGGHRDV